MGAFWGSMAALGIGASDLFGRRVVNVSGPVTAAIIMQVFGILSAAGALLFVSSEFVWVDMGWGALSGLGLASGLACYYGGLTRSSSTMVAPMVATLSAVIPYVYTLVRGSEATTVAIAGAAIAFVGLAVIAAGAIDASRLKVGLVWGVLSGFSYGFGLSVLVEASDDSGSWPAVSQRISAAAALCLVAVITSVAVWPTEGQRFNGALAGVFVGLTSIFYLIGLSVDAPPTVVTSSMFPVVSVLVGFAFFKDPVSRRQVFGIGVVLLGIAAVVGG